MKITKNPWRLASVCIALASSNAYSATAFSTVTGTDVPSPVADAVIGVDFVIGATDVTLTALGYYDPGGDGLESMAEIGIYGDLTGVVSLLTSGIASGPTTQIGDYRYVSITPIVLSAGETYRVAANTGSAAAPNTVPFPGSVSGLDPGIVSVGPDYLRTGAAGGVLDFPASPLNNNAILEAPLVNIQFDVVPEPSSALLFGLSAIGLLRRRR